MRIVDSCPEDTMKAHNPATGELIADYENDTEEGLEDKLKEAQQTFESWRERDFETRAGLMFNAAEVLRDNEQRYARLMTHEMGKPIEQAKSEVQGADRDRRVGQRCALRAPGADLGGDALELSVLAGVSVRCAEFDGR